MAGDRPTIQCETHGAAFQTFVCPHLLSAPKQVWFAAPTESNKCPDVWRSACNVLFEQEGEWNDRSSGDLKVVCSAISAMNIFEDGATRAALRSTPIVSLNG